MRPLYLLLLASAACAADAPDYDSQVRPLFAKRCYGCHGEKVQMSKLRLDRRAAVLKGGESGVAAIEPGRSAQSLLIRYVSGVDPKLVMPPAGPKLTAGEVDLLKRWIDGGAPWPEENAVAETVTDKRADHWAFKVPVKPAVPAVKNANWVRNQIDAFVLAKLEARGWEPSRPATSQDLFRRIYLDLTGLPPTIPEQDRFRGDFDGLVESLLQRPAYGERWARHWLDVVRYGDTNGYERDALKPHVWRYRDYVIESFNRDKPFDRFLVEQLAGDELPDANAETLIATGYHRLGPWDDEPADPAEDRFDQLDDMVSTSAQGLLGLTLGCARCHNHKFEPLSTRDYYSMIAIFNGLQRPQNGRTELDRPAGLRPEIDRFNVREAKIAKLRADYRRQWLESGNSAIPADAAKAFLADAKDRSEDQKRLVRDHTKTLEEELKAAPVEKEVERLQKETPDLPRAYFMEELSAQPPKTHILVRGKVTAPGPEVPPAVPAVLVKAQPEFSSRERTSGRRLGFANWLVSRDNPLTARVIVNRIWQWHFGEGLVRTASDFGVMGDRPTHPELLDWLTVWFVDNGWSVKKLHRLILASNTYRMSKESNGRYAAEDPENRLLWRMFYRRLEAEAILDSALAVSGRINKEMYGPSVYPHVAKEALEGSSDPDKIWKPFDESQASRRAIYYIVKRSLMVPLMEVLDLCDTARSSPRRQTTSVAPQALQLFNGDFVNRQAKHLARRLREEAGSGAEAQIERAYRLALARKPDAAESAAMLRFLETGTLEQMCRVILNLNEFVYTN